MALRQTKKISELSALTSASLQTTLVGVDNGTTYKVTLDVLEDAIINMVSRSTDLRLDSLEAYTASANASSDISHLNTFTSSQSSLNSTFTTGINARLQTSSFNEFSASVNTRIIAATNEQSFNGLISGSSQLTSSYDSRYVLSGSITQTTWDNISGKPDGLVSQSTNLTSLNTFTASYFTDSASIDNRIDSLESWSSSLNSTFATDLEVSIVSSSVAATIGVISQNTGLVTTSSFNSYTASISTASLVTSITNLNTYTASQSTSSLVNRLNAIESISGSWITESETGSFLTSLNGTISGSSQLTSSFDTRYTLSGSITATPTGTISGSAQITSLGFVSGSYETTGRGILSSSANLVTTSSFNSYTASISTASLVTSINALNTYTASQSTASLVTSITQLNTYTASVSTASLVTSINNLNFATSSYLTSLSGAISSSSQLTASYDTRYALSGSGGSATIPTGTVSGSSQLTSSFDTRYLTIDGDGVISGSSQIVTLLPSGVVSGSSQVLGGSGVVSGSYETTGRGIISGSSQITGIVNLANLSATSQVSASVFVGGFGVTDAKFTVIQSKAITFWPNITFESVRFTTGGGVLIGRNGETNDYGLKLDVSGSTRFTGNMIITGSLLVSNGISGSIAATNGVISGSSQLTSSFDLRYLVTGSVTSSINQLNTFTASISTASLVTSITQLNTFTASVSTASLVTSITQLNTYTASQSTASLVTSINALNSATSSYLTSLNGAISSSSQLTSSFDTRYALSGSGGTIPGGTISGSSQLTASFDLRYLVTGSVTSSINQLNIATASLLIETSNLETFSSSVLSRLTTIGTYTSSLNVWTSSVATTGSNSFNGNQIITGSLTITTGSFLASQILANTSSLYLTSGSNLYLQNSGIAEITGSLLVSGSTTLTGSISISSGSITMPNRPAFRVIGNASTDRTTPSTLSGSAVTIDYNEGNYFNTTNGLFTAPIAGLYNVYYNGRAGSANAAMQVIVYKNGVTPQLMWEAAGNTGATHFGVSGIVKLAVNDTLRATVTVGSIQFDSNDSFGATYIG